MNEAVLGTNSATEKTKEGVVWLHGGAAMASNHEVLNSVSWETVDSLFVCLFTGFGWGLTPGAMTNLYCQLAWIGNHLGDTLLGMSGRFFQRPLLRKEGPPWFWLAPFWLGLRIECKEWKKCQNSLCPDSRFSQMWGVPAACSSHHQLHMLVLSEWTVL